MDTVRFLTRALKSGRPNMDPTDAKRAWLEFRLEQGWLAAAPLLTPPSANLKLGKDAAHQTYGLALAPSDASGHNVCRYATPECKAGCVAYAGNGLYPKTGQARALKNTWLHTNPRAFVTLLEDEIGRLPADTYVRLNTFSDVPWERVAPWLIERGSFYDYTKWPDRETTWDYNLTFSASERTTDAEILRTLERMNVAVVFDTPRGTPLPDTYLDVKVIDGDKTDARWLDPSSVIVGLRAKGRMRQGMEALGMVRSAT